jgi:hypothetical protein
MAVKKATAVRPARGRAAKAVEARPVAQERSTGGDSTRMLREAAWSRMFGRVESKNPFTR